MFEQFLEHWFRWAVHEDLLLDIPIWLDILITVVCIAMILVVCLAVPILYLCRSKNE